MGWCKSTRWCREVFLVATSQLGINSQQGKEGYVTTLAQQRWEKRMMGTIKMKDAEADERKRNGMNFITSDAGLKCSANWPSVSRWWITEQQQERRKTGWDWLHGVMMKQTKWKLNYRASIDSGCTDDRGKNTGDIKMGPCSLRSRHSGVFCLNRSWFYWRSLQKKKKSKIKFSSSTMLIIEVEC